MTSKKKQLSIQLLLIHQTLYNSPCKIAVKQSLSSVTMGVTKQCQVLVTLSVQVGIDLTELEVACRNV